MRDYDVSRVYVGRYLTHLHRAQDLSATIKRLNAQRDAEISQLEALISGDSSSLTELCDGARITIDGKAYAVRGDAGAYVDEKTGHLKIMTTVVRHGGTKLELVELNPLPDEHWQFRRAAGGAA